MSVGVSGRELCLTIDPRRRAKVSKSNSSGGLEEKYIACIRSLSYTSSSEPTFDWTIFEENCSCLEDIGQVQINVNLPTVDQTFFNRISSSLPRLRARRDLSLTFVVNGKSVVRDVLGNGPHPDASNAE